MSNYDDPRQYETAAEDKVNSLPAEQATYSEFSSISPLYPSNNQPVFQPSIAPQPEPKATNRLRRWLLQGIVLVILLFLAFLGGWFGHQFYINNYFNANNQSQSYANLFQQAWGIVDQNYVDRKAINYKQMSYDAIQAMLAVLHDKGHTRFETPQQVQAENQQLSGSFTGIGIYIRQDTKTKQIIITSTIPGAPAEKAGFKSGDIILAVNGVSTAGKDIPGVSALIEGPAGSSVTLTIMRPGVSHPLNIKVTRAVITVPSVYMHYIAPDHIADIQITQFAQGASDQLKTALTQAKKQGATKIILDLREDPGGYLSEAVNTASEFMKSGNVLLVQDSSGQRTPYAVTGSPVDTTSTLIVLVNGDTASAAEIVSGALQDNQRAIIMGVKTFGTGTILHEFPLADGSAILLGTQEWLTPKGKFIRDNGITPNIVVNMPANGVILTPNEENSTKMTESQILSSGDTQLDAAIHYLEQH